MTSRIYPGFCILAALLILVLAPHAHNWGDPPTVADLSSMFFTTLGIVLWEIRDAAQWVVKQLGDDDE